MKMRFQILFILALLITIGSGFASGNVILSNQNPDPVSPGNFVYLNVKISNPTGDEIPSSEIEFIENDNFKLAQGQRNPRNLGAIPQFSTGSDSTSYIIAKYKLEVKDSTPLGLNTATFEVKMGSSTSQYNFDVLVQDKNPTVNVERVSVDNLSPGKMGEMTLTLRNENSVLLRDVLVSLNLEEQEYISTSGSNQQVIRTIAPGETRDVSFILEADPRADARPYSIPISFNYRDALEAEFEQTMTSSVRVSAEPELSLTLDSQSSKQLGQSRISYAVANPGSTDIRGLRVRILEDDDYAVLEGSSDYIGDLNPDDFQTGQTEIFLRNADDPVLKLQVEYSDSYNEKYQEVIELPLTVYSDSELREFGLSEGGNYGWLGSIVILLIIAGAFVIGRKYGFKKAKKKYNR